MTDGTLGSGTTASLGRVVVADDDGDIRSLVSIAVKRAGFELVGAFDNGSDAWAAVQQLRPDVVILDVSMPGLTGLEVTRKIRADAALAGARIIVLSAGVDDISRGAGIDAGADEYYSKPFSPRELAAALRGSA